jgi:DNA-binding CsgD family transcriptional regulator/predicted negative regulator of RcsB-dependent stress response
VSATPLSMSWPANPVGRHDELARVSDHLSGRDDPPVLVVAGEAGVGKTRLVAEALRTSDSLVLQGACFELDRVTALAPFLDLLDAAASQTGVPSSPTVSALAAAILAFLNAERGHAEVFQPDHRTQQQLVRFFVEVAKLGTVVVVLEDLHWADEASLAAVEYVAYRLRSTQARLLLSYRSEEVGEGLARLLEALLRRRLADRLELGPLAKHDAAVLACMLLGDARRLPRRVLDELWELTEGNPFALEEVLRGVMQAEGDRQDPVRLLLPRSVADSIRRRLAILPDGAIEVVRAAAVVGRRFDIELLTRIVDHDWEAVVAAVRVLIRAGLIVEETPGRLVFRHEVTRRTVEAELVSVDRRVLHARIATALVDTASADADIAFHAAEGGLWELAFDRGGRAGSQALAQGAPAAAVDNLSHALEAAHQLRRIAPELLVDRGRTKMLLGDLDGARADLQVGLSQAQDAGDRVVSWRARLELGMLGLGTAYEEAGEYLQAALHDARQLGDPRAVSVSLNRLGNWWWNRGDVRTARRLHEEARDLLEGSDDRQGLATTFELLGLCDLLDGSVVVAHQRYQQAIDLLRQLDDRESLINVLATRGGVTLYAGVAMPGLALSQVADSLDEAMTLADELDWPAGHAFAERNLATVELVRGRLTAALGHAERSLSLAEEIGHDTWVHRGHRVLGQLYLEVGALKRAREHLGEAVTRGSDLGFFHVDAVSALATALVRDGEHAEAGRLLNDLGDPSVRLAKDTIDLARAELAVARGDPHAALRLLDRDPEVSMGPAPRLLVVRSEALSALGRPDEAGQSLDDALPVLRDVGAEWWRWQLLAARARVLHRSGQRRASRATAHEAWRSAGPCAEGLPADLAANVRRTATQLIPAAAPGSQAAAAERWGGLTPRQREVAALVARGLSNQQIAEALVLSVRTVETHVKAILRQLGLASRTEVAAWAHARRLLDTDH